MFDTRARRARRCRFAPRASGRRGVQGAEAADSPLFAGSVSKDLIITITVPVFRGGEVVYDLSFNPSLAEFQRIIDASVQTSAGRPRFSIRTA